MLDQILSPGDTIAVFSPSAPATAFAPKRYQRAKAYLERKGFHIKEGRLTGKADHYRSGSIKERVQELNELIADPSVRCIMSAIGGSDSNSLLPYIDYASLREHPKIIIGYSDVTALLLGIYAKTGLTTWYGPAMVASFGELPPFVDQTYKYFSDVLVGRAGLPHVFPTPETWTEEYIEWEVQTRSKLERPNQLLTVQGGRATGRLIGGNLNTMTGIWGTEYMPRIEEGDILFIEDSMKDAATVERSFSLLKCSGVFDRIGGLILGKHELFDDQGTGRRPWEILMEVIGGDREGHFVPDPRGGGGQGFPILAEFDCCHTHPMLTLPLGGMVELDADRKRLTLVDWR